MGIPYVKGSATSKAAAQSMQPHAGSIRSRILAEIKKSGAHGLTCDEVEVLMDLKHQTASARVRELREKGKISTTSKRPTRSGRQAQVWVAV